MKIPLNIPNIISIYYLLSFLIGFYWVLTGNEKLIAQSAKFYGEYVSETWKISETYVPASEFYFALGSQKDLWVMDSFQRVFKYGHSK